MTDKLYLWRIKLRGHWLWAHAPSSAEAIRILTEQTGEPLIEYCLEWMAPTNLDGTSITPAEREYLLGSY